MIKIAPSKTNSKVILVYCSVVPYSYPPHYRISFVKQLSKHFNVVFIDLPSNKHYKRLSEAFHFYYYLVRTFFRFTHSFLWEYYSFKKFNYISLYFYLNILKFFKKKRILLYTTSGYFDVIYRYIPFNKSIFDCPDIHDGEFQSNNNWLKKYDLIFSNTDAVRVNLNQYNTQVKLISSGYLKKPTYRFHSKKIPNSVLFLGGISQRIDYEMLEKIIAEIPKANFYFAGDVYLNKYYSESGDNQRLKKWKRILKYPNTHYLGSLSKSKLQTLLPYFKIGVIPYKSTDVFNLYSNPIKLYDYLSYGMYVISTPLINISNLSQPLPVNICYSSDEFVKKIASLLAKPSTDILKYKNSVSKLLSNQSMEKKVSQVLKLLRFP